jgi:hypothetical protein
MVCIEDIAYALAHTFRFGGHTPITVAQHCLAVCNKMPYTLKLAGLLHDAHEAYIGDLVTPLKRLLAEETNCFQIIAEKIDQVIAEKFGFHHSDFSNIRLKKVDARMNATEGVDFLLVNDVTTEEFCGLPDWAIYHDFPFTEIYGPITAEQAYTETLIRLLGENHA